MDATSTVFWPRGCCVAALVALFGAGPGCASSDGNVGQHPPDGGAGSGGSTGGGSGGSATGSGGAGTGGASTGTGGGAGGSIVTPTDGAAGMTGSDGSVSDGNGNGDTSKPGGLGPAGLTCPAGPFSNPLPANLNATMIKGGFGELEGPAWVASQKALYFVESGGGSDNGKIHKYTPANGGITDFATNVGVGGLALDPDGMLVAASYDSKSLTRFDPATGKRTDVPGSANYNGKAFNEVNDVVVRTDGNMYFSDPSFADPNATQGFYRLSPPPESKVTLVLMAKLSNGLALSPDGAWLYAATTGGPAMRRMPLGADGAPTGQGTVFKELSSDGMAVDCAGNVYLSIAGGTNMIQVISAADQQLGNIVGLGGGYVTNSAFGDDDHQTLYITTSTTLYKIHLNVPGFPN